MHLSKVPGLFHHLRSSFSLSHSNWIIPTLLKYSNNLPCPFFRGTATTTPRSIVAGGICVMANPEPVSPFFDLMVLGDIEATLSQFMDRFAASRTSGRKKIIAELDVLSFRV